MPTFDELLQQKSNIDPKAKTRLANLVLEVGQDTRAERRREHYAFFNQNCNSEEIKQNTKAVLEDAGIKSKPNKIFDELNGFSIDLNEQEAIRLKTLPEVRSVELDQALPLTPPVEINPLASPSTPAQFGNSVTEEQSTDHNNQSQEVHLERVSTDNTINSIKSSSTDQASSSTATLQTYSNSTASTGEVLPYGVKAVWGGLDISSKGNSGSGTYAFVIDSGVLDTTGDLLVNKTWSKSWVSGESAFSDGNGHGTHVAGTIAALANGKGVVGVAPGAEVISLKVFNSSGGGASYSTIIDAVNYATQIINSNNLDKSKCVINLSLGGGFSSGLDIAIKNSADQGIRFSIAAGNSGDDADGYSPASAGDHENVYTVSAVNNEYQMASWSNWDDAAGGDDVDLAAPGVGVVSYYQGGELASLSGTSMAAPHVAGLLLMGGVEEGELVKANSAGHADPFALAATPTSISDANGDGLVDGADHYQIYDDGEAIAIANRRGRTYSDSSSSQWDVVAAAETSSGYDALVAGTGRREGKYRVWSTDSEGTITERSKWRSGQEMMKLGYESTFNQDLNGDDIIGKPIAKDDNGDGLVDNTSNYQVFSDGEAIDITNRRGRTYSDDSNQNWDALIATESGDGFQVLLEGAARKDGKFRVWDLDAEGMITGSSRWKTADQAAKAGWEEVFSTDLNGDDTISSNNL